MLAKAFYAYIFLGFFLKTTFAVLSPVDELYFNQEADRYDWNNHPCRRTCKENEPRKQCYYVFVVEQYSTMSKACYNCPVNVTDCFRPHCIPADGRQKTIFTVNRKLPGPLIQACENDQIIVEVRNAMLSESTAIHWHGFHQKGTPYMDGVPYVTQCPILPGESFQYIFEANMAGTFFWHSHIGSQRADGLFGALIIHQTDRNNIHAKFYDHDRHVMQIIDWMLQEGDDGLVEMYHFRPRVRPETILINGLGPYRPFRTLSGGQMLTPSAVFQVAQRNKYRFRLIDAGAEDCPIEMSIDQHKLSIISVDGSDVKPVTVDSITVWPGERVDFVLHANQRPDNYWIRYRGHGQCDPSNLTAGIYQVAILRYDGAQAIDPRGAVGYDIPAVNNDTRIFNPYNRGTESLGFQFVNVPDLFSAEPDDRSLKRTADVQHFINFDFYPKDNYDFHRAGLYGFNQVDTDQQIGTFQLNHLTLRMQPFPLLSQWEQIKPNMLCNQERPPFGQDCTRQQCACTHVIPLGLDQVVELIFVDEGNYGLVNHPLHLHGHSFRVVATENLNSNVTVDLIRQMDREGRIQRRLKQAPKKDTMKAPGGGYTVVRFVADNPGYWFFHCHFEQHTNVGMSLIFKVGEHRDFPKKPRGFPRCGGYTPLATS